jgi:transposase
VKRAIAILKQKYEALSPYMDERIRRLWAATEAQALGWGGVTAVSAATGLSRTTIRAGLIETQHRAAGEAETFTTSRLRRPGGGRKKLTQTDRTLRCDLESLVDPVTRGDPQSPLRWTCKGTARLAAELQARGHRVSIRTVAHLLHDLDYSLQANRKTTAGRHHPDRNAQFEHINQQIQSHQQQRQPVISVDAKKKELVGDFKQGGREWQPTGQAERVRVHDFEDPDLGKAIPYGVYDVTANVGWVSVGTDHDTAEFAVATIRQWWRQRGMHTYPHVQTLLVIADAGGSNGWRTRLWKAELQRLANALGLTIAVCHLPPGTSKWNKIEHRMFAHITQNWRGRPLISHEVIINLIGHTTTKTGLQIRAELDTQSYPTGRKITNEEFAQIQIECDAFHGEWNYKILPKGPVN